MRLTRSRVAELKSALDAFVARPCVMERLAHDPVEIVRRYARPRDREVVALIAASLSYGRVASLRAKIERLLEALGPAPYEALQSESERALADRVRGFSHRMTTERDVALLFAAMHRALLTHGSLEALFMQGDDGDAPTIGDALARFVETLRGPVPAPGLRFLLSSPRDGSACKRMNLFLRWVVRPDDGVDLGLWPSVRRARLVVPLDTHVARIARYIHLTRRRTPNWTMAADITESLACLDPSDPCRYDFALSHLGISGDCPRKRHIENCRTCDLYTVCRL